MSNVSKFFILLLSTIAALLLMRATGILVLDARQITAVGIFSMFIYGTLLFGDFRLAFAFGGIALLMALNLLSVEGFVHAAQLNVIIFLVGMFLVIGFLEENQFFEGVVNQIIKRVGPHPKVLLLVLMLMGTIAAALVDEVTSILFMTGTMLHLAEKYKLKPAPFIIMLVFATNIGSAASSIGNPIGVMIALNAPFSFLEFLRWSAPIAIVVNIATLMICRWWFAEAINEFDEIVTRENRRLADPLGNPVARPVEEKIVSYNPVLALSHGATTTPAGASTFEMSNTGDLAIPEVMETSDSTFETAVSVPGEDPPSTKLCWVIFLATVTLLISHGALEHLLGRLFNAPDGHLPEGTMMVGASLLMGSIVLLIRGDKARELVERRVDWWTLSFFMMLFASVGTLKETHVTRAIADRLIEACGEGHPALLIQIVGWATGWLSAFLDNVLAVATFMPVVADVRGHVAPAGYPEAIYWLMLFGGTFMGNMTTIGSTANIIACGVLEKRGYGSVSFGYWFKIGFIVSIVSMLIATLLLGIQTHWFSHPLLAPPRVG